MHKIKLVPDKPFYNRCDVTVYDVTGEKEKKRCKIAVEYAEVDVRQLKEKGIAGREGARMLYLSQGSYSDRTEQNGKHHPSHL